MNWKEIEPKANALAIGMQSLMNNISSLLKGKTRYPQLTDKFINAKRNIDFPEYNIVVCGEVKKGKSTLLNAIIGQKVLPVDNPIATSQVFRISNSKDESFSLVFTDGSSTPISRSQLTHYGSQVDANLQGEPMFENRTLAYIQVNVPVSFLPDNVSLVDTPGLGALYKSHEWITNNYITKASGVLFVFDPERPLVEHEKTFIKKVLNITPYVMFVMNKIDKYTPDVWMTQLRRTEDKLAELFAEHKLGRPSVLPMSSETLMGASLEDDEEFKEENLKCSMFPAVMDELQKLIIKSVGLRNSGIALFESQTQVIQTRSVIQDLLQATASEGQKLESNFKETKIKLQNQLQQDWGVNSSNMKQVMAEIGNICNNVSKQASQLFRSSSPIREHYLDRIDSLNDMDEVRQLCEEMPQSVANEIASNWQNIMDNAIAEVSDLLDNKLAQIGNVGYGIYASGNSISEINISNQQKFNIVRNQYLSGLCIGGLLAYICPPVGILVTAGAVLWACLGGRNDILEKQLNDNKTHLRSELNHLFDKLYSNMMDVPSVSGRSIVDEFAYGLKTASEETLTSSVREKTELMKKQLEDLEQQANLSISEKKKECDLLNSDLKQWNLLIPSIKELVNIREQIEQSID